MCGDLLVQSGATNLTSGETSCYRVIRTLKFHFWCGSSPSLTVWKIDAITACKYRMCRIGFHLNLINSLIFSSKAGVSKLTDAKALVDDLKQKAGEQSQQLAEKQAEADAALREITASMQVNTHS